MAGTDLKTHVVPSIIQGVSQQVSQARRDSQCAAQFDCINSPADGVIPRPHFEYLAGYAGIDVDHAFTYQLSRGPNENYLVVITAGSLKVFNLDSGVQCAVTTEASDGLAYLTNDGGYPKTAYCAQSVNDRMYIASRKVIPKLLSAVSSSRPKEALVFFRAGGYSLTYKILITFGASTYTWAYLTPDNSVADNADYISTDQLALTFYKALTISGSGGASTRGYWYGPIGARTSTAVARGPDPNFAATATSLGFGVDIVGNVLRIYRNDGQDFLIDVVDGAGGNNLKAFKDTAQAFSDLPKAGVSGFLIKVAGQDKQADDDYYVQYNGAGAGTTQGSWDERVAPAIPYRLDPTTMPHALDNTGLNTFVFREVTWGDRVAGDGVATAKAPYFVGAAIQDLGYYQRRLQVVTEGAVDWSKTGNPNVFFPDTVQVELATAPISYQVVASSGQRNQSVSLLKQSVMVDESPFLWAFKAQFRVSSGQDPFKASTVQVNPSTQFEFSEKCNLLPVDTQVYFATEVGAWSSLRSVPYSQGRAQGVSDATGHIPSYIPRNLTDLVGSDTQNMMLLKSDDTPSNLYCYNYLISGNDVVQSAWNTWRLPPERVSAMCFQRNNLYVLGQRDDKAVLLRADLTRGLTDPGHTDYAIRLDMRVDDSKCSVAYDAVANTSTVTLPYSVLASESPRVVARETVGTTYRGKRFTRVSFGGNLVTVSGDLRGIPFYAGLRYVAQRMESEFFLRSQRGALPTDKNTLRYYRAVHSLSSNYDVVVTSKEGVRTLPFLSRKLGTPQGVPGSPKQATGTFKVEVGELAEVASIELVNRGHLPSAWVSVEFDYEAVLRSTPPQGVGVQ